MTHYDDLLETALAADAAASEALTAVDAAQARVKAAVRAFQDAWDAARARVAWDAVEAEKLWLDIEAEGGQQS